MATTSFNVAPEDGWVQVAVAPKFIRITAIPCNSSFYVYAGAAPPAASVVGMQVNQSDDDAFVVNVTATDTYYVRTVTPQTDGAKMRFDVLTV